jgi:hypothetical protein
MCHIDRSNAILKAWQQRDPMNKRSLGIDKLVRRQVVRAALHRSTSVTPWLEDIAIFGESRFSLELDRWTVNITRIHGKVQGFSHVLDSFTQNSKYPAIAQLKDLTKEAINLDNEIFLWTARYSPGWYYQIYIR